MEVACVDGGERRDIRSANGETVELQSANFSERTRRWRRVREERENAAVFARGEIRVVH